MGRTREGEGPARATGDSQGVSHALVVVFEGESLFLLGVGGG